MAQPHAPERTASGYPRMTYEEFLALPDDLHAEWVDGEVCAMPGISLEHQYCTRFLMHLLLEFLVRKQVGELFYEPMQMRLPSSGRSPDLMVLLNEHMDRVRNTHIDGPADLVVEVMSPGGEGRDRGEKFYEYQDGGVREYWLIDPARKQAEAWALARSGQFEPIQTTAGVLRSVVIDGLWVRTDWFWTRPPVREALREMLGD